MLALANTTRWHPGISPVAVVMISLNEGHNMKAVLENLKGWAHEVFLVDSYSKDDTVDIALRYGVQVVQRRFRNFGDQWNFALRELPITAPWTMKLDPDERLSDELKANLIEAVQRDAADGFSITRRLWFMERPLPVRQTLTRVWRTGRCKFSDVLVNEHPLLDGVILHIAGEMAHHDSPDLEHWLRKQNLYTTYEAIALYKQRPLTDTPRLFGTHLQQRMWLKKNFSRLPLRFFLTFLYYIIVKGTWRAGRVGVAWARLRVYVMRLTEYKYKEIIHSGCLPEKRMYEPGKPDGRVPQYD